MCVQDSPRYISAFSDAVIAANDVLRGQLFRDVVLERKGLRALVRPMCTLMTLECPQDPRGSDAWVLAYDRIEASVYRQARALQPHADGRPAHIRRERRRNRVRI